MIGAGYYKEEGIMIGTDFERVNVITNLSAHPTKKSNWTIKYPYLTVTEAGEDEVAPVRKSRESASIRTPNPLSYRAVTILKTIFWKH